MEKTGKTWSYTYNAEGIRTRRTDGDVVYEYVYAGGDLVYMSIDGEPLRFSYSADGTPMSVIYKDSVYFYVTNLQGDVVALVSSLGNTVVEYTYDAWGNILTTTGRMAQALGQANPLRYRGYVYDNETGLYYLQSRYYNPEIGRFINADDASLLGANSDFVSYNLFAYCGNNPIARVDNGGQLWNVVCGAIFGAATSFGSNVLGQVVNCAINGEEFNLGDAIISAVGGAVYGGMIVLTGSETIASMASAATTSVIDGVRQGYSIGTIAINATISAASAVVDGMVSSQINTVLTQQQGKLGPFGNLIKWCTDDPYRGKFEKGYDYLAESVEYSAKNSVSDLLKTIVSGTFKRVRNLVI